MGLDVHAIQFLLRARKQGVRFGNVLTVGRLKLDVFPRKLSQLLRRHGLPDEPFRGEKPASGYAEDFFHCLGAEKVETLDASAYEGASLVHDLNQPVPAGWKSRYDVVCDGGTLEHVFNFPVALRNCMELVRPGGCLFLDAPGNNWFGHGFYQFSPELFYSAMSADNGYEVVDMIAHAAGPQASWYRVANPKVIRSRVELISYSLIHLMVQARRTREAEVFRQPPMQSDYTAIWQQTSTPRVEQVSRSKTLMNLANRGFPGLAHLFKALVTGWNFYRSHSLRNRRFFTPVAKD